MPLIDGTGLNDVLTGTSGPDIIRGYAGADQLSGLGSDDVLQGGAGPDQLIGGSGNDTANYNSSSQGLLADGITADLQGNWGTGDAAGDSFVGIENLFGSPAGDVLFGDAAVNRLWGGDGLDGLVGRGGADRLDGGAGMDTASYAESPSGVSVDLGDGLAEQGGNAAGDVLVSIESITGSSFADTLIGNDENNQLYGGAGDDTIDGGSGLEWIEGGAGNDEVTHGDGNSFLFGDGGQDLLTSGAGEDLFCYLTVDDSPKGATLRDVITDFSVNEGDRIVLDDIDAKVSIAGNQYFKFIGEAAFSAEGQIRCSYTSTDTILSMNVAGSGGSEMEIYLKGIHDISTSYFDF